jgi:PucR family transcriptional regulator, purine catabolism regulatory protein
VVAGESRLDNRVRWLHVSEQEDVAAFLSGGELLLTTGMLLSHDRAAQESFVSRLAEAGVAGVAVRLGGSLSEVPIAMVQKAEDVGLPLVALRRRIAFSEAMEQVHRALVAEQAALLRRAAELRTEFNDLLLQGSTPQEIVERLAQMVGGAVVVEDAAHRPTYLAQAELSGLDAEAWSRHSRIGHAEDDPLPVVRVADGEPACAWLPLRVLEESWGRLHVLRAGAAFDDLDRAAVERAAAAVLLAVMSESPQSTLSGTSAGSALLHELVDHSASGMERFRRRARILGVDFDAAETVIACAVSVDSPADSAVDRRAVESTVRSALSDDTLFTGWYGDALVTLVRAGGSAVELRDLGRQHAIGVSEPVPSDSLREAVLQALQAASAAGDAGVARVRRFRDLGLDGLLEPSLDAPSLARYVEGELGPVLTHDASPDPDTAPLLPVLEALVEANGRVSKAAARLGVDRRTLATRVPTLERLLGVQLDSFDARLRLGVALRALQLMGRDERVGPPAPSRRSGRGDGVDGPEPRP